MQQTDEVRKAILLWWQQTGLSFRAFCSVYLTEQERVSILNLMDPKTLQKVLYDWMEWARDDQIPPSHNIWTTWLLLGGRGAGKTRAGAEWIRGLIETEQVNRVALVGETFEDVREVMIEGQSGLKAIAPPDMRPEYMASRHLLTWPNGAQANCFSATDPDGLRGYQFEAAWSDELAKWRYAEDAWSNLQLGLRLGERPRQVVTTTPRPLSLLKRLASQKTTHLSRSTTYDNKAHLAEAFFTEIAAIYEGSWLGRQELMGEFLENRRGALWTWKMIEAARITAAPDLERIVVAVDPPVTSGPQADECGIIVAGKARILSEETAFIMADRSASEMTPLQWGNRVVAAYHGFCADRIVVETNQGGEMAEAILRQIDPAVPVRNVRASKGKRLRAEPVAALYEKGRVRHIGAFPKLEDQLVSFTGEEGASSPDRLDALVWALTDLMLGKPLPDPSIKSF